VASSTVGADSSRDSPPKLEADGDVHRWKARPNSGDPSPGEEASAPRRPARERGEPPAREVRDDRAMRAAGARGWRRPESPARARSVAPAGLEGRLSARVGAVSADRCFSGVRVREGHASDSRRATLAANR
jgi:hypothetical protein